MYMASTDRWYLERVIWMVAGTFTLGSALLAWLHSLWWLVLTGFVGVNLLIFGMTGFCVMANILYYVFRLKPRLACDAKGAGAGGATPQAQ